MEPGTDPVHVTARRIPSLDGVRGIAILVVVVHNASWILTHSDRLPLKLLAAVTVTGWTGVQLFFVLSGFLITGILIDTKGSEGYFRSFYTRRVLRIFPLYYVFLAGALWIAPLFASSAWTAVAHKNQAWYWTYMSNWGSTSGRGIPGLTHFWSLAVEEQFYLMWPFLVYVLTRRALIAVCLLAVVTGPIVRLGLYHAGLPAAAGYDFTVARWDALAGGALLAILMARQRGEGQLSKVMPYVGGAGLVLLPVFLFFNHGFNGEDWPVEIWGQSITILLFAWLVHTAVAAASGARGAVRRTLGAKSLRFFGKYSYAMYILHWPIHVIASTYVGAAVNGPDDAWRIVRWAAYVVGVLTLSTVLALLSWHLLEKPFLDLKDRLAPRRAKVEAMQGAGAG